MTATAQRPSAAKASLWFGAALYFNSGLLLITTPIFTRLLTPAEFGEVALFTTWTNIIALFSTLSLSKGMLQRALLEFEDRQHEYLSAILGLVGALTVLVAGPLILMARAYPGAVGMRPSLLIYSIVYTLFLTAVQIWQSSERLNYRFKSAVAVNVIIALTGAPLAAALMVFSGDNEHAVEYRAIGASASTTLAGIWLYVLLIKRGGSAYNRHFWRYALVYAFPLLPHYMAQTLVQQFDRISMEQYFSHAALGAYGLAATVASGVTLLWTAINTTYVPWSLRKLKEGATDQLRARSTAIAAGVSAVASAAALYSKEIVGWIAPASYHAAATALPLLIIASVIQFFASLYLTAEFSAKRTRLVTLNSLGAALLTAFCLFVLMPKVGWLMAGFTQIAGQMFQFLVFRALRYRRRELEILPGATVWPALVILATCSALALGGSLELRSMAFCALLAYAYWALKDEWNTRLSPRGSTP